MALITLNDVAVPAAPASGKSSIHSDSADGHLKRKLASGVNEVLSTTGRALRNYLINPEFQYAQRQVPTTLTTYSSTAARVFSADRWSHTNENTSMQFMNVDAGASPESGLTARFYGEFKKITNQGKIEVFQIVESRDSHHLRGRTVRFSMLAKALVGSHTLRMLVLEANSAGTPDSSSGTTVTAHGAAGTDPTFGAGFGRLTPVLASSTATITNSAVSCVLTGTWQRFSGTFVIPTTARNVAVCVFTDGRPSANDTFLLSEMMLTEGDEELIYTPPFPEVDYLNCLRFYQKSFDQAVAPATAQGLGNSWTWFNPIAGAVTRITPTIPLQAPMRTSAQTFTFYNPTSASATVRDGTAGSDASATAVQTQTDRWFTLSYTGAAGWVVADQLYIAWTADAEI